MKKNANIALLSIVTVLSGCAISKIGDSSARSPSAATSLAPASTTIQELRAAVNGLLKSQAALKWESGNPTCFSLGKLVAALRQFSEVKILAEERGEVLDDKIRRAINTESLRSVSVGSFCGESGIEVLGGVDVSSATTIGADDISSLRAILNSLSDESNSLLELVGIHTTTN